MSRAAARAAGSLAAASHTSLAAASRTSLVAASLVAGSRASLAASLATLLACGADVPQDRSLATGPAGQVEVPAPAPPETRCRARDDLGGLAWLPADVRLAAILDLENDELPAALQRLQRGVQAGNGLPVVAALGLGQLGLQLGILRPQLHAVGLEPRELALLHDRDGAVIWVLRARCDLPALQVAIAEAWSLRSREVAGGAVAERVAGGTGPTFAFEVAFLADDRLALVPPGTAPRLRRWLEAPPVPATLGAQPTPPPPGEILAELAAAPIRVLLAGRSLQLDGAAGTATVRTLRATAAALEIDGRPASP